MRKVKNNQFLFNQNILIIKELKNYIENYKIEDDEDRKDLYELVCYKDTLIKGQEQLNERLQILTEEEKINVN